MIWFYCVGILVNGSFATIGNILEMRRKYEDYLIIIEEEPDKSLNEVEMLVKSLLPKAILDPNPEQKGKMFRVS